MFTVSQATLVNKVTAGAEIDRVLTDCITLVCFNRLGSVLDTLNTFLCPPQARPVYLTLPTNMVFERIPSSRLSVPLIRSRPPNDPDVENFVLKEVAALVEQAGDDVIILVDACAIRHDARKEVYELATKTGFPIYSTPMGKTVVDEGYERYGGVSISFDFIPFSSLKGITDLHRINHSSRDKGEG